MKQGWKAILLAVVLALACLLYIGIVGKHYTVACDQEAEGEKITNIAVSYSRDHVVTLDDSRQEQGRLLLRFHGVEPGETDVTITYDVTTADSTGTAQVREYLYRFNVHPGNIITVGVDQNTVDFNGYRSILVAVLVFSLLVVVGLVRAIRREAKEVHYSYRIMTKVGIVLYLSGVFFLFLAVLIAGIMRPYEYTMPTIYSTIQTISKDFVIVTMPIVFLLALVLSVSNLVLLYKEGYRLPNILGILLSAAMMGGAVLCFLAPGFQNPYSNAVFYETVASVICYFECSLAGACFCGIYATRYKVDHDADFVIILGCGVAADGSPSPLLRGRVDKALAFCREQVEQTGKRAVLLPSGGKGSDECISEAESMKRYLLKQGVGAEEILLEDKSVSTYQNMKFSKAIIDERNQNAKVVFATTGYHIFRSGVFSNQVGLYARGIGSKTRWYFWPNAFVREFVGMLATEKKFHAVIVGLVIAVSVIVGVLIGGIS